MKRSSSGVRSVYQPVQCQENRKINSNILRIFVILVNQPQSTYIARHLSAITFFRRQIYKPKQNNFWLFMEILLINSVIHVVHNKKKGARDFPPKKGWVNKKNQKKK